MSHLKQQIRIRLVNICFSILFSARQGGTAESASSVDFPSPPTALGGVRFFRSLVSGRDMQIFFSGAESWKLGVFTRDCEICVEKAQACPRSMTKFETFRAVFL
ncbi:hypothetical protein TNIN_67491 [Trichonephila inaurata madagascariensis]|uniref:Uncharacterized protein n=1 Tax=Trichonephila inaurata madagascariensis TaxID=2747483 RepID=A0A8X6ID63_9ARAC|nr:hypothetical protein TNIN_67491 [Trichonephila inaurata madagascariensis]